MAKRAGDDDDHPLEPVLKRLKAEAGVDHFSALPKEMRVDEIVKFLRLSELREYSKISDQTRLEAMDIFRDLCEYQFRSPTTKAPLALYSNALSFVDGSLGHTFADLFVYCNQKSRITATLLMRRLFTDSFMYPVTDLGIGGHINHPACIVQDPRGYDEYHKIYNWRWHGPLSASNGLVTMANRVDTALKFTWSGVDVDNNGVVVFTFAGIAPLVIPDITLVPDASDSRTPLEFVLETVEVKAAMFDVVVCRMEVAHCAKMYMLDAERCTCFINIRVLAMDIDLMQAALAGTSSDKVAHSISRTYNDGDSVMNQLMYGLPRAYDDEDDATDKNAFGNKTFKYIVDGYGRSVVFE